MDESNFNAIEDVPESVSTPESMGQSHSDADWNSLAELAERDNPRHSHSREHVETPNERKAREAFDREMSKLGGLERIWVEEGI